MEEDQAEFIEMARQIEALAKAPCNETSTCNYIAFGSKACGGPQTYLAYNESAVNLAEFLQLIAQYNAMEAAFNERWNIISDCLLIAAPTKAICGSSGCELQY